MDQESQGQTVNPPVVNIEKTGDAFGTEAPHRMNVVFIGAALFLIILLGGVIFFLERNETLMPDGPLPPVITKDGSFSEPDPTVEALSQQGNSDEIADIEADLSATDLNAVSADIENF